MQRWSRPPHLGVVCSVSSPVLLLPSILRGSRGDVLARSSHRRRERLFPTFIPPPLPSLIDRLSEISVRGLSEMYEPRSLSFPRTLREGAANRALVAEGMSVRYAAIAALGLSRLGEHARRTVLAGRDVDDLVPGILGLALAGRDPGAMALSVWAAVEMASATGPEVELAQQDRLSRALDRLSGHVRTATTASTVEHAWTLVALLGAARFRRGDGAGRGRTSSPTRRTARPTCCWRRRGPAGCSPMSCPPTGSGGSARTSAASPTRPTRSRRSRGTRPPPVTWPPSRPRPACADRLVARQGAHGQWWWHYDWRYGTVVERYPVYSVHQHAMAPMALMELREAGGPDHRAAVAAGLGWLVERPESTRS